MFNFKARKYKRLIAKALMIDSIFLTIQEIEGSDKFNLKIKNFMYMSFDDRYTLKEDTIKRLKRIDNVTVIRNKVVINLKEEFLLADLESVLRLYASTAKTTYNFKHINFEELFTNKLIENAKNQVIIVADYVAKKVEKEVTEKSSFVYLMENSRGHIKIGKANNVKRRLAQLRTGDPSIRIVATKEFNSTENAFAFENMLHNTYTKFNIALEWFKLDEIRRDRIIDFMN